MSYDDNAPTQPGTTPTPTTGVTLGATLLATSERVSLERAMPDALAPHDTDARYTKLDALGEGGMGEVALLRDRVIGRDVAMKSVRRAYENDAAIRARFLREAQVQGQLEHPSIVPVYDVGLGASGQPYFTMRRVRGQTLDEWAARSDVSRHALLSAMSRVCLAVDFAHAHGVLHRDIKPSNVMIGDFGEVYVLDWGLAKLSDAADIGPSGVRSAKTEDDARTTVGSVLGTPGYMPPEQLAATELDARADVYALGACLFEALAGKPLHEAKTIDGLVASTARGANARVSERAPEREVALELEEICVRATKTKRDDRFPSARAMADAIERFLEGDRDLERRRARGAEHAARARDLMETALRSSDMTARSEAMREVGRALAMDPDNAPAMETLLRLMTEPPKITPPAVVAEMKADRMPRIMAARRYARYAFASTLGPSLILCLMPVRDVGWLVALLGSMAVIIALASVLPSKVESPWRTLAIAALALVAMLMGSRVAGPLMVVPTLALGITAGLSVFPRATPVPLAVAAGGLGVLLPLGLEALGVLPRSYEITADRIVIPAQMVSYSPGLTMAYLVLVQLVPLTAISTYLVRVRDRLADAETRIRVQAWQLRQIVDRPERD